MKREEAAKEKIKDITLEADKVLTQNV